VIAHVAGVPFEELIVLVLSGGAGLWAATRAYVGQRRRRPR
jgi:hypothetical protein